MKDEELIAEIKAMTPEQRALLRVAATLDDTELKAMRILVEGLDAGIPEAEAAYKAAALLEEHGRPKEAKHIIRFYSEA